MVDNFAGGGGASTGMEIATGISVDIAINHDLEAIRMHEMNHPDTKHYCEDVWKVNPIDVCNGHPVGLAWFSPDCKHFSKAKGGKPKDKNIRGLAWVVCRWAGLVRPRVIMLENVEEFKTWGPLNRSHRPIKSKQGTTFHKFVKQLNYLGYAVEYRELVAADYGVPTMRKRFFLIARCDGRPIVWPEPTHGPSDSAAVKAGRLKPYAGAYTQIDFTLPCPSIFDTAAEIKEKYGLRAQRPLAEKTMQRIARGMQKFILDNPEPFIVEVNHGGERGQRGIKEPLPTITGKNGTGIVEPYLVQIGQTGFTADRSKDVREPLTTIVSKNEHCLINAKITPCIMCNNENNTGADVKSPLPTITTGNRNFVVAPTLIQYHSETVQGEVRGQRMDEPVMTVDGSNRYGLVSAFISKFRGDNTGDKAEHPLPTVTSGGRHEAVCTAIMRQEKNGGGHSGDVKAFLIKYYGQGIGQDVREPLDTIPTHDRFGLVTIDGADWQIVDIGLRMLDPKELYGCQGFPDDYIIDRDITGKPYPRSEQIKRCGNAVCPPLPAALIRANLPELCKGTRMPNMRIDDSAEQLRFA